MWPTAVLWTCTTDGHSWCCGDCCQTCIVVTLTSDLSCVVNSHAVSCTAAGCLSSGVNSLLPKNPKPYVRPDNLSNLHG